MNVTRNAMEPLNINLILKFQDINPSDHAIMLRLSAKMNVKI